MVNLQRSVLDEEGEQMYEWQLISGVWCVYVCMMRMQAWLRVCVCVCEDSKFKNIGTNEYFLSCGFSSLFCFIYCLNCNNNNKEKKIFLEDATNWRHSYWNTEHAKPYCTKLSWMGVLATLKKLPIVYFCCCVPL